MISKLGKIRTESESRRPKWLTVGHYFVIYVISKKPDQIARTLLSNKMCSYHEKIQLEQIQSGRPAATFDFNMRNNWKIVPDS